METRWVLIKTENRDGTYNARLIDIESLREYEGALAKRLAGSLKSRGIDVEMRTKSSYPLSAIGLERGGIKGDTQSIIDRDAAGRAVNSHEALLEVAKKIVLTAGGPVAPGLETVQSALLTELQKAIAQAEGRP